MLTALSVFRPDTCFPEVIMFQSVIRILALLAGALTFATASVRGSVSLGPADQSASEPTTARTTDQSFSLEPVLAKNTVLREDVPYGENDMQRLDVYSPKGARRGPVVVFVHGGVWTK